MSNKYNNEYLQHRVLQFHANYDPLSATNTIGTVANVPFTGTYPHSMTNFENVDYSLYKNFVSEGLTFTETINPSYVVPESIVDPKPEYSNCSRTRSTVLVLYKGKVMLCVYSTQSK